MLLPGGWPAIHEIPVRPLGSTGQDGDGNHNLYHTRSVWNSDGSYLVLSHMGPAALWTLALHHGTTGAWIKDLFTTDQYDWRSVWSKTVPEIFYTWRAGASSIYVLNVTTKGIVQTVLSPITPLQTAGPQISGDGTRIGWNAGTGAASEFLSYGLNADGTINTASYRHFRPTFPANTVTYGFDKWRYVDDPARPNAIFTPSTSVIDSVTVGTVSIWDDGVLVDRASGIPIGHSANAYGYIVTPLLPTASRTGDRTPLEIQLRKIGTLATPLIVYRSGSWTDPENKKAASITGFHLSWPVGDPTRFFAGFFPSTAIYPYPGAYTPNVGGAWDSPNGEVNAFVPYDEIVEIRTLDNWATQEGVRVRYVCRTLTRNGAPFSFWDQPQPSIRRDGGAVLFNTVNGGALHSVLAFEDAVTLSVINKVVVR